MIENLNKGRMNMPKSEQSTLEVHNSLGSNITKVEGQMTKNQKC